MFLKVCPLSLLSPPRPEQLRYFSYLREEVFWRQYNLYYGYHSWNKVTPSINVAFAHFWYKKEYKEKEKIHRAAYIGLPSAIERMRLAEEERRKGTTSDPSYIVAPNNKNLIL